MKNKLLFMSAMIGMSASSFAQSIETPANTALTIASDVTLPSGKGIQSNGSPYMRLPALGSNNVQIGFGAGVGGGANTFVGQEAGRIATGNANVFIGNQAGYSNTTGTGNMFLGQQAGANNTTGNYNLFLGNSSGSNTSGGSAIGNTFIGDGSGYANTTGTRNTYIGQYAGFQDNGAGTDNTFIGYFAKAGSGLTLSNATAIGAGAVVGTSNAVVLGNSTAKVGIGISVPANTLHIGVAAVANTAGLRLPLSSTSTASVTGATKFLSVNANGDVILASINASPRVATSSDAVTTPESYWQLAGGRLSNSSGEAVVIGKGISKLGGNYGLYVEKGILTEKVKVAVKNTSEWSDYVFAPEYKLRKLSEVESFIKSHGHLPGVPSAEQVVAEGVDMAKMDATLLQKIEELTLYMVDMKKEVNTLRQANVKLQQKNNKIERQIKQMRQSSK